MKNKILSNNSETFWSTDIEAQQQLINELDRLVPKTAHLANPNGDFADDAFVVWDDDKRDWVVAEDEDPREWSVGLASLDEMVDKVKEGAPWVLGIGVADALRRAQPGYQLRHAIQLSPAEELAKLQKLNYAQGGDFTLAPPEQIAFDKWLQDHFRQLPADGSDVGLMDKPIDDPWMKASEKLKGMYNEIKSMTPEQAKAHMRLHSRGTAKAEWNAMLGEPLTEEIIRSTWDNPKEGVKWWRDEIIKAEKAARARHHRMNEIRKMLGKPPLNMQSDSFFHSDVVSKTDWEGMKKHIIGKQWSPKATIRQINTATAKIGGVVGLVLSLIALIRTSEDPDVVAAGGVGKAITEGWQGPWFKEFMKGLGHFVSGGEEGAKAWTIEHFVYFLSAHPSFGWDQKAKWQLLKEIPKSLKDVAMGAIVEPLMWLAEKASKVEIDPIAAAKLRQKSGSTPMGQYPPQVWE